MQAYVFLCLLFSISVASLPLDANYRRSSTSVKRQSDPVNQLLAKLVALFPINVAVEELSDGLTLAQQGLATVAGISTSENAGTGCADMTIIFARGTAEPGNVGIATGPWFFNAVKKKLGSDASLAVRGVDYPASVEGFLVGGDPQGTQTM